MTPLIAAHASAASLALVLGGWLLLRRRKGDRGHRRVGMVWVGLMYAAVLSSFAIRALNPGHLSWIHGLSAFTFVTLTVGTAAAVQGRRRLHRRMMTGSYLGLVGAGLGAVAVPQRGIPQLASHEPLVLVLAGATICIAAVALVGRLGRSARIAASTQPA